jgi:hypothetical protein
MDFRDRIEEYHQESLSIATAGRELSIEPLNCEMGAVIHLRLPVDSFIYKISLHLPVTEAVMLSMTFGMPRVSFDKLENLLMKEFIS